MRTLPKDDNGATLEGTYRTINSGSTTVVTSGTPVQLTVTRTDCKRLDIVALATNTGTIYIGGSTTLASTNLGIPLQATGSFTFFITDVSNVYIDSTVSGDKVSFVYFD